MKHLERYNNINATFKKMHGVSTFNAASASSDELLQMTAMVIIGKLNLMAFESAAMTLIPDDLRLTEVVRLSDGRVRATLQNPDAIYAGIGSTLDEAICVALRNYCLLMKGTKQ